MKYCVYSQDGSILKVGFAPEHVHQLILETEKNVVFFDEDRVVSDRTHYVSLPDKVIHKFTEVEQQAKDTLPLGWTWKMPNRCSVDLRSETQKKTDALLECSRQRAKAYPSMEVFADAKYWESRGDPTKLEAYFLACDEVKRKFPKPYVE